MQVRIAKSNDEVERCFAVMRQLRPQLSLSRFIAQVARQVETANYTLAYLEESGQIKAVIGYRISEYLAWGKALFIDDLVTDEGLRGKKFGGTLFDWAVEKARESQCDEVHLESGVQRFEAHRFYLAKKMHITGHHFGLKLK
jgi:GNAT superfamily N-acetyltransferase